jgi:hypothetical protein
MTLQSCNRCGRPAELTVSLLISTVGRSPRQQKCGESVHFCRECLRVWIVEIGSIEPRTLERSAWRAYTAIVGHCGDAKS